MKKLIVSVLTFMAAWLICTMLLSIIAQPIHIAWRAWASVMVAGIAAYIVYKKV